MKIIHVFATALLLCLTLFGNQNVQAFSASATTMNLLDDCPTARFSIVNNGALAGTPIQFTNQSTGATSYLWDFGDGTTSTDVNPSHVYSTAGTYTVKLYATGGGCTVEFIGTEEVIVN